MKKMLLSVLVIALSNTGYAEQKDKPWREVAGASLAVAGVAGVGVVVCLAFRGRGICKRIFAEDRLISEQTIESAKETVSFSVAKLKTSENYQHVAEIFDQVIASLGEQGVELRRLAKEFIDNPRKRLKTVRQIDVVAQQLDAEQLLASLKVIDDNLDPAIFNSFIDEVVESIDPQSYAATINKLVADFNSELLPRKIEKLIQQATTGKPAEVIASSLREIELKSLLQKNEGKIAFERLADIEDHLTSGEFRDLVNSKLYQIVDEIDLHYLERRVAENTLAIQKFIDENPDSQLATHKDLPAKIKEIIRKNFGE